MKRRTLCIRLDEDLEELLSAAEKQTGRSRSELAREAMRRQLRLVRFETVRQRLMPFSEARGLLTDEDMFSRIS